MYLAEVKGYVRGYDTGQGCMRERFLILVQDRTKPCSRMNFRALVRTVAMKQCGQFMMGRARVKGKTLIVSGSYGGDGLPMNVDPDVFKEAMPVPESLYEAWAHGNGWNGAGNEAAAMRKWANTVFLPTHRGYIRRRPTWDMVQGVVNATGTTNLGGSIGFRSIPVSTDSTSTRSWRGRRVSISISGCRGVLFGLTFGKPPLLLRRCAI